MVSLRSNTWLACNINNTPRYATRTMPLNSNAAYYVGPTYPSKSILQQMLSTAYSSGAHTLGIGFDIIRTGKAELWAALFGELLRHWNSTSRIRKNEECRQEQIGSIQIPRFDKRTMVGAKGKAQMIQI